MVVALVLVLVVVLVAAAVVAGAVHLVAGEGAGRVIVGLTVGLVLAVVAVISVAGLGGSGDNEPRDAVAPTVLDANPSTPPLRAPTLRLVATNPDALPLVPPVVGDLERGAAVVVGVTGLEAGSTATVHQCPTGALAASDCRPGLPFRVGDDERASVLVDLQDRFGVGRSETDVLECSGTECSVVVFGSSRLEAVTVFDGPAPPPITVDASPRAIPPGGTVAATAGGLSPGAEASFVVCRPGGEANADCGPPTPRVRVDADGMISAPVTVSPGRCPRGETCAVAVVVGDGGPRAFARLQLTGRSGAGYDGGQVALGIGIAGLLLAVAVALLLLTDWTPVGGDPFAGVEVPEDPFADVDIP